MNEVKKRLSDTYHLKSTIKNGNYFTHIIINNYEINVETISIVMTSHNRSKQAYFTLKTISQSSNKNIHIILVDDSTSDPINLDKLKEFPFYIDFISIKNKIWKNPCVNYNIGFNFIKGTKLVIQNSEVCHVNDPIKILDRLKDGQYFVFDVISSPSFAINDKIYSNDIKTFNGLGSWYQHHIHRNACYHFLTAMTVKTFELIREFSYDYSFLSWYDDDDFVFKIKISGIKIINIKNESEITRGIHLFHNSGSDTSSNVPRAQELFNLKKKYYEKYKKYLEISDGSDPVELEKRYEAMVNGILV